MEDHTRELLKECSSGCKMAINSINQMREFVTDEKLKCVLDQYDKKHKELEEDTAKLLQKHGSEEQEPGMMASMFSRFMTDIKLLVNKDDSQVAKLAMDGCNMGIQSVGKFLNQYDQATKESRRLAEKLLQDEEDFMGKLREFL